MTFIKHCFARRALYGHCLCEHFLFAFLLSLIGVTCYLCLTKLFVLSDLMSLHLVDLTVLFGCEGWV